MDLCEAYADTLATEASQSPTEAHQSVDLQMSVAILATEQSTLTVILSAPTFATLQAPSAHKYGSCLLIDCSSSDDVSPLWTKHYRGLAETLIT